MAGGSGSARLAVRGDGRQCFVRGRAHCGEAAWVRRPATVPGGTEGPRGPGARVRQGLGAGLFSCERGEPVVGGAGGRWRRLGSDVAWGRGAAAARPRLAPGRGGDGGLEVGGRRTRWGWGPTRRPAVSPRLERGQWGRAPPRRAKCVVRWPRQDGRAIMAAGVWQLRAAPPGTETTRGRTPGGLPLPPRDGWGQKTKQNQTASRPSEFRGLAAARRHRFFLLSWERSAGVPWFPVENNFSSTSGGFRLEVLWPRRHFLNTEAA